jgi:hypothetical protein
MSGVYDLEGARKAGVADADSLSHLASTLNYDLEGARAAGISDADSLSHLASAKPPAEPVVEKESPEALGGMGGVLGGVAAAGDVIYSKGRPLFRMAEKALGMDSSEPTAKPRKFLSPVEIAQQAIERRTAAAPDVTGSPSAVRNWGLAEHKGEFLGGGEYGEADKIKKEAMAFEKANPTKKVLPGSLLAVPEEEATRMAKQRAELAAQEDLVKQAEVKAVAEKRAERLGERANLKGQQNKFTMGKGAAGLVGKAALPILGGYEAGAQGAQAYNRLTRPDLTASDVASGGTNIVGSAAGALSMLPSKVPSKVRIPAAIVAQGASKVADWLDKRNPRNEEEPIKKADGGLVGYAGGKAVGKVAKKLSSGLDLGKILPSTTFKSAPEQTVTDPLRNAFPGIYKRPDVIAQEAAARVAPENPALKQLFGVTRDDLYQMGKGRVGNMPGVLPGAAANPKGSRAALNVMNPRNEQRLLDVLSESEKHPELVRGMDPWYIMDPAYKRLEELVGPEEAVKRYKQLNTLTGMASPGSDVLTEMNRGTAANYLATQGRFNDFVDYAGKPMGARGADFPDDLRAVMGHPYHRTAQAIPMQQYLDTGAVQMSSPKVPAYIQASSVPQTGFQTDLPVGDAHWSRAVGLADTRGAATRKGQSVIPGASVSNPEMSMLAPWWKDKIAGQVGLESVPAQARAWGAFSPQTGVESPIGAPKLELLSMKIMEAANRYGVSPEQARDMILKGEGYAGKKEGGLVEYLAKGGKVPEAIVKAYKLFKTKQNAPGELYPLFVNANKPVPMNEWVNAEVGPVAASGKVKSKLGELAYRPGWHAGDLPVATHIGGKSEPGLKAPDFRRPDEVWAEVEMPADVDWQTIANQRARLNKAGEPIASTAHITDTIPEGGHYRYKTSPNMQGNWLIGGNMKVNKVLTDEEVQAINEAAGVADLPRFTKFDEKAQGGLIHLATGGQPFNPQGADYDYQTAMAYGMGPNGTGENAGHWGSVAPTSDDERMLRGLPEDSYVVLKGKNHPTFHKAEAAEQERGSKIVKVGDRYYSIPK